MIEWIISSSALLLVLIALRWALRGRINPRLQYALWALALVRLLVPVSFGSAAISVGNLTQRAAESEPVRAIAAVTEIEVPVIRYQWSDGEAARNDTGAALPVGGSAAQNTAKEGLSVAAILKLIWLCGIAVVGAWFVLSNLRMARSLRKSRVLLDGSRAVPVYVSGAVDTPCLFGLLRPAIYLTGEVAENGNVARHAVEHELTHYRHRDNIWALLRCVCLAVHWYNPLVWCAAICSRNDAELACDEATIKRLGEGERADYGRTLIRLTCEKRPALLNTATTMTGSGKSIKTRIALIVKKPKMAVYTAAAVVLIAAVAVGCTFTGANEPENGMDGMTVYDCGGLSAAIPEEYVDELIVYAGAETGGENVLLKVYGKAVTEAFAAADLGENDDMGWLFSLVRWDQARYEEYLGEDGSGINVFAQDDTWYYVCVQPTDVTFYPTGDKADQERWVVLNNTLAAVVREDFITRNQLSALGENADETARPDQIMAQWELTFPANDDGRSEYSEDIFAITPFDVQFQLPSGWYLDSNDPQSADYLYSGLWSRVTIFDQSGQNIGAVGYNVYDPDEVAQDEPMSIYSQIAIGNDYQFNVRETYCVVRLVEQYETGTADVWSTLAFAGDADVGEGTTNYGILSYSTNQPVYIAFEFDSDAVTQEQVTAIAQSVVLSVSGSEA